MSGTTTDGQAIRVVAIISTFNEGDVIGHVIRHLVDNGVEVYVIDNHSTDDTVAEAKKWLGRGVLDITLYRDDLSEIGPGPLVRPTEINIDINGSPLLLVDDVLFTGRSIRAAMDALSDFGRPSVIRLVVLVDRNGRELPIQPDFAALVLKDVSKDYRVNVRFVENDGKDEITVEPR